MTERFEAELQLQGKTATFVEVPLDVPALFGRARAPVRGTVNGAPFRSTVAVYGGRYFLPVNRALREAAGAVAGETVIVDLETDDAPRAVEVPDDLGRVLGEDEDARAFFAVLSYTHQREYVEWIVEAKRDSTRRRRVEKTLELLRAGKRQR